jgi:tRNA(fMet)-specific endonuclease VapC
MILVDSDHLSVLLDLRERRRAILIARLAATSGASIPIVAIEEQLRGWLAQIRRVKELHKQVLPYAHFATAIEFFQNTKIVRWSAVAADIFGDLRKRGVRIGTQDLKIGALALEHNARLLSANLRDFQQIPGLQVEDWLR